MQSTINTIATQTLSRVEEGRKLKARCGLDDDTMKVAIVAVHTGGIDATVDNGASHYETYLHNDGTSSCTCPDNQQRKVGCKHAACVAYFLLGSTTPEAQPQPFALGDIVQLRGLPQRAGKVICVSHETISVLWPAQGLRPRSASAHHEVELELASWPAEQKQAA